MQHDMEKRCIDSAYFDPETLSSLNCQPLSGSDFHISILFRNSILILFTGAMATLLARASRDSDPIRGREIPRCIHMNQGQDWTTSCLYGIVHSVGKATDRSIYERHQYHRKHASKVRESGHEYSTTERAKLYLTRMISLNQWQ